MRVRPLGHRSRLTAATLVATVTLGPALAGCSGGDSSSSGDSSMSASPKVSTSVDPSASVSLSASPPPSSGASAAAASRPPKVPAAANDTAAARKAFAAAVIARWGYALRTDDAGVVTGLSPAKQSCQGCHDFAAALATRRKQHWYVDFPGATVRSVTVTPSTGPHTYLAHAKVDIPGSRSFFTDGSYRNDNPAHRGATFDVRMSYAQKRYTLLAFQVR